MKKLSIVIAVIGLLVFVFYGCSKDEGESDTEKLQDAINGEYSAYFNFSEAFSADDEALLRTATPTEVYDSIYDWRYPRSGRSITRDVSVDVSGDVATINVSRTLTSEVIYRCWLAESLVSYTGSVTFTGSRTARFVKNAEDNWDLDAISPVFMQTSPSTVDIDSVVAVNNTTSERYVLTDPTALIPIDSLFRIAPEDTIDVYAYTGADAQIIFRHPRSGHYERTTMSEEGASTYRYGLRVGASSGVRFFVVDAITTASALDSTAQHDGEIWGITFVVE